MTPDTTSGHNMGLACNGSDQETPSPTKLRGHLNKRRRQMDDASTIHLQRDGSPTPGLGGDAFLRSRAYDVASKLEEDDIIPASPDEGGTPWHDNDDEERTTSETGDPYPAAPEEGAVEQWAARTAAEEHTSRDMGSIVYVNRLVVMTPRQHTQAHTTASELPNFKAFRRRGQQQVRYDAGAVVDDDEANPYTEAAAISDTFFQEAASREKAHQLAEDLFTKEIRASKAPTTTKRATGIHLIVAEANPSIKSIHPILYACICLTRLKVSWPAGSHSGWLGLHTRPLRIDQPWTCNEEADGMKYSQVSNNKQKHILG